MHAPRFPFLTPSPKVPKCGLSLPFNETPHDALKPLFRIDEFDDRRTHILCSRSQSCPMSQRPMPKLRRSAVFDDVPDVILSQIFALSVSKLQVVSPLMRVCKLWRRPLHQSCFVPTSLHLFLDKPSDADLLNVVALFPHLQTLFLNAIKITNASLPSSTALIRLRHVFFIKCSRSRSTVLI